MPSWISNTKHYKVWDDISNPFPTISIQNFTGCTVEVWKWISNSIPHFTGLVITYRCLDWNETKLVQGVPDITNSMFVASARLLFGT